MELREDLSIQDKIIVVTESVQQNVDDEVYQQLTFLINELINKDFSSLLQLLYRIDVDENKIRLFLQQNLNEDSASVIANLIIERQLEKLSSRALFTKNADECDEEKW